MVETDVSLRSVVEKGCGHFFASGGVLLVRLKKLHSVLAIPEGERDFSWLIADGPNDSAERIPEHNGRNTEKRPQHQSFSNVFRRRIRISEQEIERHQRPDSKNDSNNPRLNKR